MKADSQTIVEVLLPLALEGAYSYSAPSYPPLKAGDYVVVPLGTRQMIGTVWATGSPAPQGVALRPVAGLLDMVAMGETHRKFIDWVSAYYCEPKGNVLRMVLRCPAAFEAPREKVAVRAGGAQPKRMTPQRRRVLEIAREGPALRPAELAELAGVGTSVIKALVADGALEAVALPALAPFALPDPAAGGYQLSSEQQNAAQELRALVARRAHAVTLLDGVTGSGKTEVYFEAIAAALAAGQQVLLLLPEIALTGQFLTRVEERFGAAPASWHSDMRPRERERVWRGIATGEARIAVGARSALFLPWRKLGLIVVDEEHEGAYKQEDGVPYHARDMAVLYGSLGQFPVILSSATPSLETLANADRGRYGHLKLANRHGRPTLPDMQLIDMRTAQVPQASWISEGLAAAVAETLRSGDQALLFLNRRGYAPLTLCRKCGHRMECPNCAASLVEHRFRRQLMCHHCGHAIPVPRQCPKCESENSLTPCGPGIERLAEEAARRFPEAQTAILSSDLARGASLRDTVRAVAAGKYNLVIGTQLVAKGHHFPHLTLAGVVDADLALENSDPRAGERTWALMAQIAGRTGRGAKPGRALIQTYVPDHPLMQALQRFDRDGYLDQEKTVRREAELPPYGRLAALIVSGSDPAATERFARALSSRATPAKNIRVLGPAPAPISLVRGRHRWRFLVKSSRDTDIQAYIRGWLAGIKPVGSLRVDIDVDPYNFL